MIRFSKVPFNESRKFYCRLFLSNSNSNNFEIAKIFWNYCQPISYKTKFKRIESNQFIGSYGMRTQRTFSAIYCYM